MIRNETRRAENMMHDLTAEEGRALASETESDAGTLISAGAAAEVILGHLDGVDDEGRVLFKAEGSNDSHPVAIGISMPDDALVQAAMYGQRALAVRTTEARPRLVLTGLVRERVSASAKAAGPNRIAAKVDGESVELSASTQIELRCGNARILMHRSGRIEISGTYVLTRSRGRLKLKGAAVEIN